MLAFSRPHLYLPFFVTALALAFGLMGIGGLWKGITPAFQLLALAMTVGACLIATLAGYEARHDIRQQELLNRVRSGYQALLNSIEMRAMLVTAFSLFLVLLVTFAMIQSDLLWAMARWFILDPAYLEQVEALEAARREGELPTRMERLRTKMMQVLPFTLMSGYVAFMTSFTYSSSLLLALTYANEMNKKLPPPIFLQDRKLAKVVRRDAEVELGRLDPESESVSRMAYMQLEEPNYPLSQARALLQPPQGSAPGGPPPNASSSGGTILSTQFELWWLAANWVWDELERTDGGGVRMKVARENVYELPKAGANTHHRPHRRVSYVVRADPWGRIREIKQEKEPAAS